MIRSRSRPDAAVAQRGSPALVAHEGGRLRVAPFVFRKSHRRLLRAEPRRTLGRMADDVTASEALAELTEARAAAQRRVHELEAEQRAAGQARQAARAALVEAERHGARPAELRRLEEALAAADARPGALGARIEGARAALIDARGAVGLFTRENLDELVAVRLRDGEVAAERLSELAREIQEAYAERERIAHELSALVTSAGIQVRPGDISRSRAEGLARAASDLVMAGGEEPPRLTRDPRVPLGGVLPESLTAA
jgi:hypothetical protein